MNYYFISSDDGTILESEDYTNEIDLREDCQKWADQCDCEVWVIKGEHSGITCTPTEEGQIPPGALTCGRLSKSQVEQHELEIRKLAHWKLHGSLDGFTG